MRFQDRVKNRQFWGDAWAYPHNTFPNCLHSCHALSKAQARGSRHSAEIRGSEEGERVEGMKKISKEQAHIIADVMMKLKWKFQLTKALNGWVLQTQHIGHL